MVEPGFQITVQGDKQGEVAIEKEIVLVVQVVLLVFVAPEA